jgi:hypothetical protein
VHSLEWINERIHSGFARRARWMGEVAQKNKEYDGLLARAAQLNESNAQFQSLIQELIERKTIIHRIHLLALRAGEKGSDAHREWLSHIQRGPHGDVLDRVEHREEMFEKHALLLKRKLEASEIIEREVRADLLTARKRILS